ncbi:MAG: hypothetical protein IPN76_28525 [Saprospiraceae bacterium]|nr:hypothetical protein [Saprospiraceae bacterium]
MSSLKERITTYFVTVKIFAALLILSAPCIVFVQDEKPLFEGMVICLPFWILGCILVFFAKTRDVVYFDGKVFYIHHWKGQLTLIVPAEKITLIYSLPIKGNPIKTLVVHYHNASDKCSVFYIFAKWNTSINSIIKKIREVNP